MIVLSVVLMGGCLIGLKMLRGETGRKQAKIQVQDSAHKEVISSKDLTITTLKDELRSIKGKLYRTQQLEEEEDEESDVGVKPVTWEEITALVHTTYPKIDKILPLAKKQIMEMTKDMTMKEILEYVKQFTGNKQSEESSNPQSIAYNPNWA